MKPNTYFVAIAASLLAAACTQQGSGENSAQAAGNNASETTQASPAGSDGPFGYRMGDKIAGLKLDKMEKPGFYRTSSPPKPNVDFETVVIEAYPDTGICQIRGIGKDLPGDGDGSRVRNKVDELADALATKYGQGRRIDRCTGSDISCQSQFWMMNLNDGERFYGYSWESQNSVMKAGNMQEITVAAGAADIQTSYPIVEYRSANASACDKARKGIAASSL